jgi:hypothetical protein
MPFLIFRDTETGHPGKTLGSVVFGGFVLLDLFF